MLAKSAEKLYNIISVRKTNHLRLQIFKRSKSVDEKIAISLDNVSYYYISYDVLGAASPAGGVEGVSRQLAEGSFVALVGRDGCGKSTLANLLNGMLLP